MSFLIEHGEVAFDLPGMVWALRSIPPECWIYRQDPESKDTRVVREGRDGFPTDRVASLIEAAAAKYFKPGYSNRVVLSCVPAGKKILPHSDDFGDAVRSRSVHCHVPITTSPSVVMGFPDRGETVHMKAGHLYTLDETERHCVDNPSGIDRVHLLFAWFPHGGKEAA